MKILALGDYHGQFSNKLLTQAKKSDLVISLGDYFPGYHAENFVIERAEEVLKLILGQIDESFLKKEISSVREIFKKLNSLNCPVVTTYGNYDKSGSEDTSDIEGEGEDVFSKILKDYPKIKRADYKAVKIKDLVIIGCYGSSFPGRPESKKYKESKDKLSKLFEEYSKENSEGKVIFISHNVPYNTKLDKINDPKADPEVFGKHYGSKLVREIIEKYKPSLHIAGHMHENQGFVKLGKTICVDAGPALEGKGAIIEFDEILGKVNKLKFIQ